MKTSKNLALLAAFGMVLAGMSSLRAQPAEAESNQAGPPPGPPHARFGQVLQGVIRSYDANKDGQLDSAEMAALEQAITDGKIEAGAPAGPGRRGGPPAHVSKEIIDTYDTDKDGILSDTERAALRKDVQERKLPPTEVGNVPHAPFRGALTAEQILQRFDADQDGKLDAAELNALLNSRPGPGAGPMHRRAGGPRVGEREEPQNP
jgi:Ca2+-binding EF-hand superfamily protein